MSDVPYLETISSHQRARCTKDRNLYRCPPRPRDANGDQKLKRIEMCGIYATISTSGFLSPSQALLSVLCQRGPDHLGKAQAVVECSGSIYHLAFTSTVLSLRGDRVTTQPFVDSISGSILCWNGEAWKTGDEPVGGNDGQTIFDAIIRQTSDAGILKVIQSISGPFAFVFYDQTHKRLFFGRDRLGRRSLLCNDHCGTLQFSSVSDATKGNWKEVEADGIYIYTFEQAASGMATADSTSQHPSLSNLQLQRYTWPTNSIPSLGNLNRTEPNEKESLESESMSVNLLRHQLTESIRLRVTNVPVPPGLLSTRKVRFAVLFSGGLDCTVLARIAHELVSPEQEIDLINVAFENPRVVEAAAKQNSRSQIESQGTDGSSALLPDKLSFNSPSTAFENCPDRVTGRKALQELCEVCPSRTWRFIAVDVPYWETLEHRARIIGLIHPHNTEMDLSIACALYFAARGIGTASVETGIGPQCYTTPARVLLSGLGADELFGGYNRHAIAFEKDGYQGLLDELDLDISRLGRRNLGRDDRVISHWGREARFPYLDESLVQWAVECPIWQKCGFRPERIGQSDPDFDPCKRVLRSLAKELGLRSVSAEKKRAIQFGARTAKMETGKTKGTTLIS